MDYKIKHYKEARKDGGKEGLINKVYEDLKGMTKFYFRKAVANAEERSKLFRLLLDEKHMAKPIAQIGKEAKEYPVPDGLSFMLLQFLEQQHEIPDEIREYYLKAIAGITAVDAKKLVKKLGLPKKVAVEFASILPNSAVNKYNCWVFARAFTNRLYNIQLALNPAPRKVDYEHATQSDHDAIAAEQNDQDYKILTPYNLANPKMLKNLFKYYFGKDQEVINNVFANILLEKKFFSNNFTEKQMEVWDALTNFVLETMEDMKKEDIYDILERYAKRRQIDAQKNRDGQRRVTMADLPQENYPRITNVLSKINEGEKVGKKKKKKK